MKSNSGGKAVRYNKWGYIFLIPFIVVFVIFQLVPLVNTIYNSFFEKDVYKRQGWNTWIDGQSVVIRTNSENILGNVQECPRCV